MRKIKHIGLYVSSISLFKKIYVSCQLETLTKTPINNCNDLLFKGNYVKYNEVSIEETTKDGEKLTDFYYVIYLIMGNEK